MIIFSAENCYDFIQKMIDIIFVNFFSERCIISNIKCLVANNKSFSINIIIVDNSNSFVLDAKTIDLIKNSDNLNLIIKTPSLSDFCSKYPPEKFFRAGSIHHAEGIAVGLINSKSSYKLILDPDFFIFGENSLDELVRRMIDRDLLVSGAGYAKVDRGKYTDFPAAFCMLLSNEIRSDTLDFLPIMTKRGWLGIFCNIFLRLVQRSFANFSCDTGHKVRGRLRRLGRSEVFQCKKSSCGDVGEGLVRRVDSYSFFGHLRAVHVRGGSQLDLDWNVLEEKFNSD